ncbi:MAG TPA: hypothetical protein VFH51_02505 [Myxococcota bacterium]|nr:hypothetical protein [Myxococcota bacterium]
MPKPQSTTTPCLNDLQVSRLACGEWGPDESTAAHLHICTACAEKVREEDVAVRSAAYESVPGPLLAESKLHPPITPEAQQGRSRDTAARRFRAWGLAGAFAAVAMAMVLTPTVEEVRPATVRLKGAASLAASVKRGDAVVVDDRPLEEVGSLRVGDQVRLHLTNLTAPYVAVELRETGAWSSLFEGEPPMDGWLPFAIEIITLDATQVRVITCPAPPSRDASTAEACEARHVSF